MRSILASQDCLPCSTTPGRSLCEMWELAESVRKWKYPPQFEDTVDGNSSVMSALSKLNKTWGQVQNIRSGTTGVIWCSYLCHSESMYQ